MAKKVREKRKGILKIWEILLNINLGCIIPEIYVVIGETGRYNTRGKVISMLVPHPGGNNKKNEPDQ